MRPNCSPAQTFSSPTSAPGALRRIGLDFETVATDNPRLVYGLITGYGTDGPDADRAAYDVAAFWARGGMATC